MAEHDALRDLYSQVGLHLEALDDEDLSEAEKAVVIRNLTRHLKVWVKVLDKEAASKEARAFVATQRKTTGLRAA